MFYYFNGHKFKNIFFMSGIKYQCDKENVYNYKYITKNE